MTLTRLYRVSRRTSGAASISASQLSVLGQWSCEDLVSDQTETRWDWLESLVFGTAHGDAHKKTVKNIWNWSFMNLKVVVVERCWGAWEEEMWLG